ncbi:DUF2844 domain-containing protein [Paraburkholderia sp. Tr-20389]|uniref:DUF2844 domain-containing protein n=1 Tax=Paraburkholderia sp. Tr-20389 TaxID=2703903 RepID=UPI00198247BE|nr:DUF2844 domain-containing protein [Paraburkholderia sp. Tr-20389]MBN3752537.1 DUF2844 domain-containing protein [Paraburkholderia sp. Tr-20389]
MKIRLQCLLAAVALANCISAHAALGAGPTYAASASASSTQAVRRMSASAVPYTVNEATLADGTLVREYVGQSGVVFAATWHGPHTPDLSSLLGSHFAGYLDTVNQQHAQRGSAFGPATVQRSDVVVETGGHMGAYVGRAWVPADLPAGMSSDDIQ